jgi:tRNA U34 5-methylaminomethyl-2-thiouridine-forming methyltransferase MnmC
MYELCAYFTNDGTMGLFSKNDDDIYHSTYGALSESWQKFILPSRLEEYLTLNNEVKILDICYGIGYNTKTALNVFIKNILEKHKKINFNKKLNQNIAPIDTDNILSSESKNILIDAVDLDNVLINLSPFVTRGKKNNFLFKKYMCNKYFESSKVTQIKKIKDIKFKTLPKEYKLRKEVNMIIAQKMLEQNQNFLNDSNLLKILFDKKYKLFFDKFMLNYAQFYQKKRYNYDKKENKLAFLHNIYYRYVSRSYKNIKKLLKNSKIDVNFHNNDARSFIKTNTTKYNFIYLDAFTPTKCPMLWTVQFFNKLYNLLENDGMILTYSNSAAVRNALLQNGFAVGKIYNSDSGKFIGTVATKNENLIQYKLGKKDLDLINSKAGICFNDNNLDLDNETIIKNREKEMEKSDLLSSSKVLKGYKNGNVTSI